MDGHTVTNSKVGGPSTNDDKRHEESETTVPLEVKDFEYIRTFLLKRSAISLDDEKRYLVESRLQPLARKEGFASVGELVHKMQTTIVNGLHQRVIEAMTTHETSFFRDINPFDAIRRVVLPELITARGTSRTIKIWCMACSTGQEPYSLAMLIREYFPQLHGWVVKILATDLSAQVLERAREGRFNQHEINRGLPAPFMLKYFTRQGMNWQANDDIRSLIDFQQMNLIEPWTVQGPMDIIFLRNVLIYFELDVKKEILAKVRRVLRPDGSLLLGGSENAVGLDDSFRRVQIEQTSVYRLR
ncbi:CheR family methyltransferase [Schlesneria paludicola]|uniref:CheR family methyltransferase n=1 Tax=Schlesneria paludicola TaxID=360056 RepID=UPI00029A0B1D|nr:protein-glutamate O-methyltransferase CheR [Schlesneria paludicola]